MASIPNEPPSPPSDISGASENGKRKFSHTTTAQRQCLLEWLELPGNFDLLTKPVSAILSEFSTSTLPTPKRIKKMDVFRAMAQHMNKVAHTNWSEKTARSRFESFMATYRKAKRQRPENLPPFYRRVDALFEPNISSERRFKSESSAHKSEQTRSTIVPKEPKTEIQELSVSIPEASERVLSDEQTPSPTEQKAQTRSVFKTNVDVVPSTPLSPLPELTPSTNDQTLSLASQQLAVKQQELELKQFELRTRQEEKRQKLRAEVLTKLVEAGKSPAEVREYLAIMDPVDNAT